MYRSGYRFKPPEPRKEILDTVESTIIKHFTDEGIDPRIGIPYKVRNQHLYVPGKTRHGKSTLFHAMAYQDIRIGAGICVIDPKGDLVSSLANWIPESRKDDCVYLSPKSPVPINFFDYTDDDEKETLVGELKYVITRGAPAESAPLMDAILTDLIYTLFNANEHPKMPPHRRATFLDLYRFLEDPDRQEFIKSFVTDRSLLDRWNNRFPHPKDCAPTITRMTPFIRNPSLRKLFDCPDPVLNIAELMDMRKILLVDLGGISQSTQIFATLLIAKIRQAAFRRSGVPQSKRIPFFLYVDEFEFFQTKDFDQILSFAAGYGLRLTIANQFIGQLDPGIRQSIFGNVGSFIVFCVSPDDARYYKHIAPEDIHVANLPKYMALFKIAGKTAVLKSSPPPPPPPNLHQLATAEYIRKRTLDLYSCKSPPVPDNLVNEPRAASPPDTQDPPQKEKGRPTVPPVGSQQGNPPGTPKPLRRPNH
jgi:hypothetical protein